MCERTQMGGIKMSTEIKMMKLNGLKITEGNDIQYYSYDTGEKSNTVVKYGIYAKMVDIKDETEVNVFLGNFDKLFHYDDSRSASKNRRSNLSEVGENLSTVFDNLGINLNWQVVVDKTINRYEMKTPLLTNILYKAYCYFLKEDIAPTDTRYMVNLRRIVAEELMKNL